MNEDEEKIPIIDLPEAPELPTDGVEYSKMPADEIRQLIDVITGAVYQQISRWVGSQVILNRSTIEPI